MSRQYGREIAGATSPGAPDPQDKELRAGTPALSGVHRGTHSNMDHPSTRLLASNGFDDTSAGTAMLEGHETEAVLENRDDEVNTIDLYYRQAARVPLLDREGEVAISRRIEVADHFVHGALASKPALVRRLVAMARLPAAGPASLDAETLEVVAGAIEDLGARGHMVGIVTHVRELADRIPVQFLVTKDARTSRVEREPPADRVDGLEARPPAPPAGA